MITIISGTNRKNSNSIKVAVQYQELLSELGVESSIIDLEKLPEDFMTTAMYDNIGKNTDFNPIMEQMKECQKFVFIVPEYNGSFPGALKLFLDGLEFPGTLKGSKCAMVGISSGVQGAVIAMSHLTDIFNYLGMHVMASKPKLMGINGKMENDRIVDEPSLHRLKEQATQFIEF